MNLIFLSLLGVLGVGAIVDSLINNSNIQMMMEDLALDQDQRQAQQHLSRPN